MNLTKLQLQQLRANQCLVFTDLDGSLLGHRAYDFGTVPERLAELKQRGWQVVMSTSKTWAEVKILQQTLGNDAPVCVENGAAIHWPTSEPPLVLGVQRRLLQAFLATVNHNQSEAFKFSAMGEWSTQEVMAHTGLEYTAAILANERDYTLLAASNRSDS